MSLPNPVPIALCGKNQNMASSFGDAIEKDGYKVVHTCSDVATAKSTLPSVLGSDSGPVAVVIGKGFSDSEMHDIINHCKDQASGAKTAWLLPDDDKFTVAMKAKAALTAGSALPGMIADRAAAALKEHGVVAGKGSEAFEGGVFGF